MDNYTGLHIFDMPNEILVIVFNELSTRDKLSLTKTCRRFDFVLHIPELIRSLDFTANYSATLPILQEFFTVERCEHIRELNINSCYWLKRPEVTILLSKLKNLTALYAADTSLDLSQAHHIMGVTPKLQRLSFTWSEGVMSCSLEEVIIWMSSLEFLYLHFEGSVSHRRLGKILENCNKLKELWLVYTFCDSLEDYRDVKEIKLPQLDKLVVLNTRGCSFATREFVLDVVRNISLIPRKWKWLVLNFLYEATPSILKGRNDFGDAECLSGCMSWRIDGAVKNRDIFSPKLHSMNICIGMMGIEPFDMHYELLPNLSQLSYYHGNPEVNILGDISRISKLEELRFEICARKHLCFISLITNLKRLSLTACILHCIFANENVKAAHSYKKQVHDIGEIEIPVLEQLTVTCPNLEELELRYCSCECNFPECEIQSSNYNLLSKWTKLRRITLESFYIKSGSFITQIASSCKNLEYLNIKDMNLGNIFNYSNELIAAISCLSKLRDFRFEHADMGRCVLDIIRALTHCSLIERVLLTFTFEISCSIKDIKKAILQLVDTAKHLVYFHIFSPTLSSKFGSDLKKAIMSKYSTSRPALIVEIICESITLDTPFVHFLEICDPVSTVSMAPFHRRRFISHCEGEYN